MFVSQKKWDDYFKDVNSSIEVKPVQNFLFLINTEIKKY